MAKLVEIAHRMQLWEEAGGFPSMERKNPAPKKKLSYQVIVQADSNLSKSDSDNSSTQASDESIVTWIKPLKDRQRLK